MAKEIKSLTFKEVLSETRKSRYGFSTHLLFFTLFTLLSLILAYVAPFSLIITIPLVIVPSYFAFTSMNAIKGKKNSENVSFFKMYRTYFSMLFFGGYRLLIGLLKAFLTYVVSNFIIILVYDLTIFTKSEEFKAFMKLVEESTDTASLTEAFDKFTNSVLNNPEIQKWLYLAATISTVLAILMLIHHIFKHSVKIKRNLFVPNAIPAKQFNIVERKVRKEHRKFIWGSYTRCAWFIQVLIILAAAGGIVGSFFFLKDFAPEQAVVITMFLIFLVMLPFMNHISKLQEMMFVVLLPVYESTFATFALEFITKYKEKIGIPEEDVKKIEEILNATKNANQIEEEPEEKVEENKEDKDLEDK